MHVLGTLGSSQGFNSLGLIVPAPDSMGGYQLDARKRVADYARRVPLKVLSDYMQAAIDGKGSWGWSAPQIEAAADIISAEYEKRAAANIESAKQSLQNEVANRIGSWSSVIFDNIRAALDTGKGFSVPGWITMTPEQISWIKDIILIESTTRSQAAANAQIAQAKAAQDAAKSQVAAIQMQLTAALKSASDCADALKTANANLALSTQAAQDALNAKLAAEKDAAAKIAAANTAAQAATTARAAAETAAASQVSAAQAAAAQAEAKRQQAAKEAADAIAAAQAARNEAGQSSALAKQAVADREAAREALEAAKAEAAAAIKAAKDAQEAAAAGSTGELAKQKAMVRNVAIGGVVLALFAWRLGQR